MGWLHCRPSYKVRDGKNGIVTKRHGYTRGDELIKSGGEFRPDIPDGDEIFPAFMEYGPAKLSPMGGLAPLEWPDVQALVQLGLIAGGIEAHLIRDMSVAYCEEVGGDGSSLSIPPSDRPDAGE